ncbi:aldehyde dehydrogenase family protein [Streptomyces sp. NPDC002668]|uniref:aldehyde dehydrogenase family protein n=1 Tax=Streptomyces sp. NPDC002668 TaxID=3154422 RepID=UPI003330D908
MAGAVIAALDILHKLFAEGQVVIAKMNPVNAYLRPHFEHIFAEFVERSWVRFVDGGAAEGGYLAGHEDVDAIHVTGSDRTHDAIVWGTDEDAEQRRRDDRPLLDKPFSSELGGVSPCIVVPGPWSDADFRFQAENIVTSKMNNSGHNCIASQILVLPRRRSTSPGITSSSSWAARNRNDGPTASTSTTSSASKATDDYEPDVM